MKIIYESRYMSITDIDILDWIDRKVFGDEGIKKEQWSLIRKDSIVAFAFDKDRNNQTVGTAVMRLAPICYLYSCSVLHDYRRIGIGSKLVELRLRYSTPNKVQAHTETDNFASIKNLQNFGFKPHSYVPDFYKPEIDAILWELNNYAG